MAFDIFINQTLLNIEKLFKPDSSNSFFDTLKSRFLFNISDSLSWTVQPEFRFLRRNILWENNKKWKKLFKLMNFTFLAIIFRLSSFLRKLFLKGSNKKSFSKHNRIMKNYFLDIFNKSVLAKCLKLKTWKVSTTCRSEELSSKCYQSEHQHNLSPLQCHEMILKGLTAQRHS